ncbi:putative O-methyltransferase [Chaetomidium leptoderma]|uniref:O-methyltransferase n=1 Tax=Chaetomidium leptoderma TaxID=669021 RepID=A0AAN6VV39_9PEZI|nr:putative O-methyltransferase [Chaetomidium leptoderma]
MTDQQPSSRPNLRQALELAGSHFVNLVEIGILKAFIDFGVFDKLPESDDESSSSITVAELAARMPNCDEATLERMANFLVAAGILASPSPGRVAHTPSSRAYCTGQVPAGFIVHVYNFLLRPVACWSTFFERQGGRLAAPVDSHHNPLGLATGHPARDLYGILDAEPKLAKLFNAAMQGSAKIYSLDGVYDFGWMRDLLGLDDGPAIVDVGGSSGGALIDILSANAFVPPARCAVLDLPQALEGDGTGTGTAATAEAPGVQLVSGSMFALPLPAPVRGALVYHLRRVLNDFPDGAVAQALTAIRAACRPDGTSRVLIVEELLHSNRSKFSVAQDIFVMNFGGKRRSANMFGALADRAGFRVNAVLEDKATDFGVVELVTV